MIKRYCWWNSNEFTYCAGLVQHHGDDCVGRDPKTIATYLRLQAAVAYQSHEYELSSRLGAAATCINEDARNSHDPRWDAAFGCFLE